GKHLMSIRINFAKGERIFIDEREHEFFNFVASETGEEYPDDLQFIDRRDHRMRPMTREEFDELYLAGRLRWKSPIHHDGDDAPEEHSDDADLRGLRQAFTKAFDDEPVSK